MKLLFDLDVKKLEAAQRVYNGGKYQLAPRVVFLRAVLDDIIARNKTKQKQRGIVI